MRSQTKIMPAILMCGLFLAGSATARIPWPEVLDWEVTYEGDVLPDEEGWVRTVGDHRTSRGEARLNTENTINYLNIKTVDTWRGIHKYTYKNLGADFGKGVFLTLRVRVHEGTMHSGGFAISDTEGKSVKMAFLRLEEGNGHLRFENPDPEGKPRYAAIADMTGWIVYRIAIQGDIFSVYLDEGITPVFTGTVLTGGEKESFLTFGDDATDRKIDIDYDYVRCAGVR